MIQDLFPRGFAIGFVVAFALGPIGLLVIRRTLERGWTYGLACGAGVATADATYGAIAAFGLTALTDALVGMGRLLGVVGGAVLVMLAARAVRQSRVASALPSSEGAAVAAGTLDSRVAGWATMVGLTLTNPATILSFAALFASIGAGREGMRGAVAVVAGVFLGSVAWWVALTALVAALRTHLTARVVRGLNVASAVIVGAFGLVAIGIGIGG